MPFTIYEGLSDLPEFQALIAAVVALAQAEKTAVTYAARQAASEPVQRQLAALIDKVIGQIKD